MDEDILESDEDIPQSGESESHLPAAVAYPFTSRLPIYSTYSVAYVKYSTKQEISPCEISCHTCFDTSFFHMLLHQCC